MVSPPIYHNMIDKLYTILKHLSMACVLIVRIFGHSVGVDIIFLSQIRLLLLYIQVAF